MNILLMMNCQVYDNTASEEKRKEGDLECKSDCCVEMEKVNERFSVEIKCPRPVFKQLRRKVYLWRVFRYRELLCLQARRKVVACWCPRRQACEIPARVYRSLNPHKLIDPRYLRAQLIARAGLAIQVHLQVGEQVCKIQQY